MAIRVTPRLVELTYEAALRSFWRRHALRKFLRSCGVAETTVQSWVEEESKRDFLDRLFATSGTENGRRMVFEMATALSEQTTFPDLRNWEDSAQKIQEASKAVAELKAYMYAQREEERGNREREEAKARARTLKAEVQRSQLDKAKLQNRVDKLHASLGTQEGGYAFQDWFYDLLDFSEIQSRRPYTSGGRQIDGSLTVEGTTYLVELKFTATPADAVDIDSLRAKVEDKADNTMGVLVSMSGFTSVAISQASGRKTTLLLLDARHLYLFLTGALTFEEILSRIRRHASQTGEAYLAIEKF